MSTIDADHRSQLLALARDGNSSAIEELFACYQHYLRFLAHRGLSDRVRARVTVSDVIQETFLHAFQAMAQFRGRSTTEFMGWLRSILASRIADAHQKHLTAARRDVRREVSIETINAGLEHSSIGLDAIARDLLQKSPGAILFEQERAFWVADAIGRLPADYQEVILLRHFDSLSFEEVARKMGRSSGAVRMVWLRAIQKMKQNLQVHSL